MSTYLTLSHITERRFLELQAASIAFIASRSTALNTFLTISGLVARYNRANEASNMDPDPPSKENVE